MDALEELTQDADDRTRWLWFWNDPEMAVTRARIGASMWVLRRRIADLANAYQEEDLGF